MHRRAGHGNLMETAHVVGDLAGSEVIVLAQIENLADDVGGVACGQRCGARGQSHSPAAPWP